MYAQSVFHLPLSLQRDESLVDVGSHVWVYVKIECLYSNLVDKPVNLTFQLVGENNARLNLSLSEAGGVKKGAFDEATAQKKFDAWKADKQKGLDTVRENEAKAKAEAAAKELEAEKKLNEAIAQKVAEKKAAEAAAKAEAEAAANAEATEEAPAEA